LGPVVDEPSQDSSEEEEDEQSFRRDLLARIDSALKQEIDIPGLMDTALDILLQPDMPRPDFTLMSRDQREVLYEQLRYGLGL
jgi:hypothetical protein